MAQHSDRLSFRNSPRPDSHGDIGPVADTIGVSRIEAGCIFHPGPDIRREGVVHEGRGCNWNRLLAINRRATARYENDGQRELENGYQIVLEGIWNQR